MHPRRSYCVRCRNQCRPSLSPLDELVEDLKDTLWHHRIAIGLAAQQQIGHQERVAIVNIDRKNRDAALVLVNPCIERTWGKKDVKRESCMSLPHLAGKVERRWKVAVRFQDKAGRPHFVEAEGFLARVIAHEVDHLDGLLYADRVKPEESLEPVDLFSND